MKAWESSKLLALLAKEISSPVFENKTQGLGEKSSVAAPHLLPAALLSLSLPLH